MEYSDDDCIKFLEKDGDKLDSYCLIDVREGAESYTINVIMDGVLFN